MKSGWLFTAVAVVLVVLLKGSVAFSVDEKIRDTADATGYLEVECNIADESLYLCSENDYAEEERTVFFGLFKTYRSTCSGEKIFLGKTPVNPVPVPAGEYVLLVPQGTVWEREGPIKVQIVSGKKTYFLLKLFNKGPRDGVDDYGGSGGGGGGGGGGGAAGSPP